MQFPSILPRRHREFLQQALPKLGKDPRVIGIAALGSFANNMLDQFSDLAWSERLSLGTPRSS